MPIFSPLRNPDTYLPGLWDFAREPAARTLWARRLRTHLADTITHARAAEGPRTVAHLERIAPAWEAVIAQLADLDREPPGRTVLDLVAVRDALFRGEPAPDAHDTAGQGDAPPPGAAVAARAQHPPGPHDVFARVKDTSNAWALAQLPELIATMGPPPADRLDPARLETGILGMLAGNVLDVASAEVAEAARAGHDAVERIATRVRERPLPAHARERLGGVLSRLRPGASVLLFADNAGMDFVLGVLPFGRELVAAGVRVAVGVNERPALNDVTVDEARELVAQAAAEDEVLAEAVVRETLHVVSTGNATPGIDLRRVSDELNRTACDLAVFVGQGRAIETTWNAVLSCPSVRVATLKNPLVADRLGLRAFDTVVDVREAGAAAPA